VIKNEDLSRDEVDPVSTNPMWDDKFTEDDVEKARSMRMWWRAEQTLY
jgi:hypothetical protein